MLSKKLRKIHPITWIVIGMILVGLLLARATYAVYDWAMAESRDYILMDELNSIASDAEAYKKLNGSYPENLSQINKSDKFCVYTFNIKKCTSIYYKPSSNLQDFKMAADASPVSGAWPILFYSPHFSVTRDEMNSHSADDYNRIRETYGTYCWFCAAYKSESARGSDTGRPIYKQDPKIFTNPDEWPDIQ